MENGKDGRFGQFIVTVEDDTWISQILSLFGWAPRQRTIVSRVIFGDSFYAAMSVLWGNHDQEAEFRDGEILVVMSMDPKSPISEGPLAALQRDARFREEDLFRQLVMAKTEAERERIKAEAEAVGHEFSQRNSAIPRGVVVHPALEGRELAWSAIRIDFTFNVLDRLESEAMKVNGGVAMPTDLKQIQMQMRKENAATWQLYERPAFLGTVEIGEDKEQLVVSADRKPDAAATRDSRFAVSMFGSPETGMRSEDDLRRLPELEQSAQRLLDWLSAHHPDYWRLNDFSEALSILRWTKSAGAPLLILDMDREAPRLLTPDRVFLGIAEPRVAD